MRNSSKRNQVKEHLLPKDKQDVNVDESNSQSEDLYHGVMNEPKGLIPFDIKAKLKEEN
jgi:hypothetical protein